MESEIGELEKRKGELVATMGAPDFAENAEKVKATGIAYRETDGALQKAYSEWDTVSDVLEQAEKEFG